VRHYGPIHFVLRASGPFAASRCRSLDFQLLRLPAEVQLVIGNTMVQHDLSVTEYNTRRAECEEGVRRLARALPGIRALRAKHQKALRQ
jgi:galactokinase